jgi:hypothetical protein
MTIDVICYSETDLASTAGFKLITKAKNIAGTVTVFSPSINKIQATDPALAALLVECIVAGVNVDVTVTGIVATNLKWFAAANVTRLHM